MERNDRGEGHLRGKYKGLHHGLGMVDKGEKDIRMMPASGLVRSSN